MYDKAFVISCRWARRTIDQNALVTVASVAATSAASVDVTPANMSAAASVSSVSAASVDVTPANMPAAASVSSVSTTSVVADVNTPTAAPVIQDIGLAVGKRSSFTEEQKYAILGNPWKPPVAFEWPFTERKCKDKVLKKYLGPQHFQNQYSCFSYSQSKQGIFCKACVFFGPECVRGQSLGNLVRFPLQNYARLLGRGGYLTNHVQSPYHEAATDAMNEWMKCVQSGAKRVDLQLNKKADAELKSNRAIISRILYALEYHGRLGLPLRGHRDFGDLPIPESCSLDMPSNVSSIDFTQGNFRSTLQLMIGCADNILKEHCEHSGRNLKTS